MRALALVSALAAATLSPAVAWWCDGHMLVASIAYANLSNGSKTKANALIELLATDYPTSPDFITSACWADDLKSMGVTQYNNWHFVDLPVTRGAIWNTVPAVGNTSINPWAIKQSLATLSSSRATQLDQAIQLRFLIHFAGDIHQPLHAAALFSAQFPTGDMGGNLFPITGANQTELHALWDSGINQWSMDLVRPLNTTGQSWIAGWTNSITAAYPASQFNPQLQETDPFVWAGESNNISNAFVYNVPQAPVPVPAAYLQTASQIVQQQVALGGYRLALAIESVLNEAHPAYARRAKYMAEEQRAMDDHPSHLRGSRN